MKVFKFKCSGCGSTRYKKHGNSYKCIYCGNIQDVIVSESEESKTQAKNTIEQRPVPFSAEAGQIGGKSFIGTAQKSIIIRLIICIFAGFFGVHKFIEGKIFLGIVYIITHGFFGIGVIVDVIRYVIDLVHISRYGGGI